MHNFLSAFIKYFTLLLELLLSATAVLKFLGASQKAIIVDLLYKLTDFFIKPFKFIFPNFYFNEKLVDLAAISAIIGYLIVVWLILKLMKLIFEE